MKGSGKLELEMEFNRSVADLRTRRISKFEFVGPNGKKLVAERTANGFAMILDGERREFRHVFTFMFEAKKALGFYH